MNQKRFSRVVAGSLLLLLVAALVTVPKDAEAIPAFARKYQMSCTTCHAPFPRIKDYADEFAGNGFVLKDKEATRYFVETGDKNLDLIRDFPFAVRFDGFIKHHTETERDLDLTVPYNIKLLSGGSLTKDIAYYFYFFFSERGEVAGLEDAFVMFNDVFGTNFDIYIGQFQVSDPLFKRELRLTYEDYQIYRTTVGSSDINLTYDRGIMVTYGFESGLDLIFEIVNGNGLVAADSYRTFDKDQYKNFVGRVSKGFGEYLRAGLFGYYGKEAGSFFGTNDVWFLGPDITITPNEKWEFNAQFVARRDDNPNFALVEPENAIETNGGFIEALYFPEGDRSKWYAAGLYNQVESDFNSEDYESLTAHFGYLLRTNFRLVVENTYDIDNEENRFLVGFIAAY